jgi:hypothetical protein
MKLQIEKKNKPEHNSRLNKLVFGVALLWLVTSVLLLVFSATGSAQHNHKYEHKNNHTRSKANQQLFAWVEQQTAARASFIY